MRFFFKKVIFSLQEAVFSGEKGNFTRCFLAGLAGRGWINWMGWMDWMDWMGP